VNHENPEEFLGVGFSRDALAQFDDTAHVVG